MGAVVFNYPAWIARYPEFTTVTEPTAALYFLEAEIYCDNTATSRIEDEARRSLLLNMLTAHIAQLNATIGGVAPSGVVGRVSSASEGSVSVSTDYQVPGTAAWYAQTKYGAAYWQATARYRTMRYIPAYQPFRQPRRF